MKRKMQDAGPKRKIKKQKVTAYGRRAHHPSGRSRRAQGTGHVVILADS
jgi:hypothetical protein